jgi:hypothetical protein
VFGEQEILADLALNFQFTERMISGVSNVSWPPFKCSTKDDIANGFY